MSSLNPDFSSSFPQCYNATVNRIPNRAAFNASHPLFEKAPTCSSAIRSCAWPLFILSRGQIARIQHLKTVFDPGLSPGRLRHSRHLGIRYADQIIPHPTPTPPADDSQASTAVVAGVKAFFTVNYEEGKDAWLERFCATSTQSGCLFASSGSTSLWRRYTEMKTVTTAEVTSKNAHPPQRERTDLAGDRPAFSTAARQRENAG